MLESHPAHKIFNIGLQERTTISAPREHQDPIHCHPHIIQIKILETGIGFKFFLGRGAFLVENLIVNQRTFEFKMYI
jgi:hypothetical protein